MIAGACPGLRLSHRGHRVIPDAMRVKGEDMQESREMNGPFQCGFRNAEWVTNDHDKRRDPFGCAQGDKGKGETPTPALMSRAILP